ncbi:MAG TPA: hypothetical protein VM286_00530 [Candidatus Thermoplasmatota archaeon]|nr:hypothetical protein [Candidatus Thermoplasmatota archaeon]
MAREPAPSGGADALRRSLDSQAVDAESEDRPYLVSLLQRLGYTDAQIEDYLAGRADPGAAPTRAPAGAKPKAVRSSKAHARTEPDHGEVRDVEVEYTGPGLQDYRLVDPVDFFGDDSGLLEFQPAGAGDAAPEGELAWAEGDASGQEGLGETAAQDGETGPQLNAWEDAGDASEGGSAVDDGSSRQGLAWDETQAQDADQTIHYGDYTLYQKDDLRDGQTARVFAFSKTPPGEGYEAATALPEGYEIAENPDTGRPFLRRIGEEDWGLAGGNAAGPEGAGDPTRRRVRLKRVRAANREEAMRLIEREGGNPLASVPIDIEKHLGDE